MKKNKKIISIIVIIIAIIALGIIVYFNLESNEEEPVDLSNAEEVYIGKIFEEENSDNEDVSVIKSGGETVAEKYKTSSKVDVANAKVKLMGEIEGKLIYVRNTENDANIFQSTYEIKSDDENENPLSQVAQYIQEFKNSCLSYLNLSPNAEPIAEAVKGAEEDGKYQIPVEESIYEKNRLYTLTYEAEENDLLSDVNTEKESTNNTQNSKNKELKRYDINFYMNDGLLVCEFAYIL